MRVGHDAGKNSKKEGGLVEIFAVKCKGERMQVLHVDVVKLGAYSK